MNAEQIAALIERVEAAEGPSDRLDELIVELAYKHRCPLYDGKPINYDPMLWQERYCFNPTASLDAALTLLPEGCEWSCGSGQPAHVWKGGDYYAVISEYGDAATPALALVAACLRAMEASRG